MIEKEKTIKVLIVEPLKPPYVKEIANNLCVMQNIVGGIIQAVYPEKDNAAFIVNDDGKLQGLPLNRALYDENGKMYDIIAGTFFICGLGEDDFASLNEEQIRRYAERFHAAEIFLNGEGNEVWVIRLKKKSHGNFN